ncbi:ABC transporter ATP-binding protein [Thermoanaerobacterium sp. DL9XJH110]|uniref:ABC transporter ATP-binding protein n=1 Tax=Thermoanaerobacterium sp. DL9XJH110 TaxID=3386643 RepID=UPI003BB6F932
MSEPMLDVRGITMKFGSLVANEDVSFAVNEGEIVSLIGPNGAGKTTLFNCITGFYKPHAGKVFFNGVDITGKPPHYSANLGLTRTFQIVKPLKEMTVRENVMTGAFLRTSSKKQAEKAALEILELTHLADKSDVPAASLTIADKKRLEIARALATRPKMLMLDEAMAGLNQTEIKDAMELCLSLKRKGVTLLIVEHIMEAIMPISDRVVVLNAGRKIADDVPEKVTNNEEVIKAYLGERYHAKSKKS